MKTIITILFLAISTLSFSSKYKEAMKSNIDKMYQLNSSDELQVLANQFERIGNAETKEWLPNYYAAYCFMRSTFFDDMEATETHIQLDKAQSIIDKLQKNFENESEIYALQAFVYQLRITDMGKGAKYSRKAAEALGVAEKLNADNPRVYYLRGSNTFHTPKFFGGGAEKAKPDLQKAAEMFESNTNENKLMPSWGSHHNKQLLAKCTE